MNKKLKLIVVLTIILTLISCANVGHKFNISELENKRDGLATVFFYRQPQFKGGGATMNIIANNIEIISLDNGAYYKHTFSPGAYKVHTNSNAIDRISTFSFEAGKTYFIKVFIDLGLWVSSVRFVQVHKNKAISELRETAIQL